jgi:hypothetical protein
MEVINEVLDLLGVSVDDLELNERYELEGSVGIMDLTIEKVGASRLSVAHYYTQRGDLMRDPEIVFDTTGAEWTPVEYRQDPVSYKTDSDGVDLGGFEKQWSDNLREQGFVDAARAKRRQDHEQGEER